MKKTLLILLLSVITFGASAQTHKFYAGGQLTFGRTTAEPSGVKSTQVTVLPEIGYNITDRFGVGTHVGVQYRKTGDEKMTVFRLEPYARYSYLQVSIVQLFVDFGVDFGAGRADGSTAIQYGIGFRPGVLVSLNDRFSLVAHVGFLGYQSGNNAAKRNGTPENWGLNLNSENLMFGFSVHF